jgi:hypothetical protein
MTISGQFSCPPPGSFVAVSGHFLAAVVNHRLHRAVLSDGIDQIALSLTVRSLTTTDDAGHLAEVCGVNVPALASRAMSSRRSPNGVTRPGHAGS